MMTLEQLKVRFAAAIGDDAIGDGEVGAGAGAADRVCAACVDLLAVDGAAISLLHDGVTWGTVGSSGDLSNQLDELQYTFGEGPCLDAVAQSGPVLAIDLGAGDDGRWPAFSAAVLDLGIQAVLAMPIPVAGANVGALDLFRLAPGGWSRTQLGGGLLAAEMAGLPLLHHISAVIDWELESGGPDAAAVWERVEVYQATGMIIGQLDVGPEEALIRLRGYAFAHGMTASEVAWNIVERRLRLADDGAAGRAA